MTLKFCVPCGGSGKQMGGGMIIKDCTQCAGRGKNEVIDNDLDFLESKDTEAYKKAFEEEFVKQGKKKGKKND